MTGFRVAAGGCAELYGLKPDIVTYGKALGAGLPGGRDHRRPGDVMAGLEWGKVLHYGTHNAGRLALAVTKTMLEVMLADDQAGFRRSADLGADDGRMRSASCSPKSRNRHDRPGRQLDVPDLLHREGEHRDFRDFCAHVDRRKFRDFVRLLHRHGVFMSPSNTLHSLSCIAHTDQDIDRTADAIGAALEELR